MNAIEQLVVQVIASEVNVDANKINKTDRIVEDLKADSLDTVEIIMALENAIGVRVLDSDIIDICTVQNVIDVAVKLKEKQLREAGGAP